MNSISIIVFYILLFSVSGYAQEGEGTSGSNITNPGAGLLPVPQHASFSNQRVLFNEHWSIVPGSNVAKDDPAVVSLIDELKGRFGMNIKSKASANGSNDLHTIELNIRPGSVPIEETTDKNKVALRQQAYRLKLDDKRIVITANASSGLFYGVQTFIQLLQSGNGKTFFAGGEITDWPDMELRMIYWDDAHHLERLDAMKRAIRQAAYYKINALTLKLEGHFEFSAAKPIVEPYAYTPVEFQELTDYAKAHYVELIPYLDAPAHISFILKHPEYNGLRSFPNSNYEFSVTNPKSDDLLLGMFDNLMEANRGGKYLFFSTDEGYYVGKAESEKRLAETLGGNGKLYAQYISRISNKLHEKGREVIIWGEFPLTPSDVNALPSHLINGINDNSVDFGTKFKDHGIRHLVFTSTEGVEPLFPNYYKPAVKKSSASQTSLALTDDELQQGDNATGRVAELIKTISGSIEAGRSDLMGVVVCGWGDGGLNPETFWLGYAGGMAASWNRRSVNAQDVSNRFYHSFYGGKTVHMDKVYQLLSTQAEFWDKSWPWERSNWRTPIFGRSNKIFDTAQKAKDQILDSLPVPSGADLSLGKDWNSGNQERLQAAEKFLKENQELMNLLYENLINVDYQHYNLEVFRSVAQLCHQNLNMLLGLQRINELLKLSSKLAASNPAVAVSLIDQALDQAKKIRDERNEVLQGVTAVWYQDWYPRVAEANGRKYLDQVDDVKDHPPVRTVDMDYLIYRQLKYPLGRWFEEVVIARNQFATKNNLSVRSKTLEWETTK